MFGRIFLGVLTAISLVWLGYATYDRVNQGKQFSPEYLFGNADGEMMILLNPEHQQVTTEQFTIKNDAIRSVLGAINLTMVDNIYLSKKRGHVLIETNDELNASTIASVFNGSPALKIKEKQLSFGTLKGKYAKNTIYLSVTSYDLNTEPWKNLHFDKNADASIIGFNYKQPAVTDVYIKENGVVEYKASLKEEIFGSKVNDKVVFGSIVPASVSSYEFYETDYLRYKEPALASSPMNSWLKYGLVRVVVNGQEAIITDYIEGQEPIQVLYDFYKRESSDSENEYFNGNRLTSLLKETNGFYIYQVDDFVVISGNRAVCETIVGDYKLGNTLAQQPERSNEIYSQLPQKVNFRKVTKTEKQSASLHESVLLTTVVGGKSSVTDQATATTGSSTKSFVAGNIKDVLLVNEQAFFVTTNDNKVLFFENDKKKWEQSLEGSIVGDASIIDIYANEKSQLMVSTDKKVHVIDANGNQPGGFPIDLDDQVNVQTPLFYRWKGNGFFLLAGEKGRLLQYDNQGRELAVIRTRLSAISMQPVVWVSANKPFIGIYGDNRFEMIQADTRKSLRIFDAHDITVSLKLPNEVKLYGVRSNQLLSFDQRGGVTYYEKFVNGKLIPTIYPDKGLVVKDQQQLRLFNSGGIQWGSIKLPFTDLADAQIFTTPNGTSFIGGVDGLENKVYLWKSNGELFSKQQFDGSKLVRYSNGYIFTVIDNLVVRYAL